MNNAKKKLKDIIKDNPNILLQMILEKNNIIKLKPNNLVILLYICLYKKIYKHKLTFEKLSEYTGMENQEIHKCVKYLLMNDFLSISQFKLDNKIEEEYDINNTLNKLLDDDIFSTPTNELQKFVFKIEEEFSRKLSPFEIDFVNNWITYEKYTYDELKDALKETIISGVRNLKYLDRILRDKKININITHKITDTKLDSYDDNKKDELLINWDELLNE